MKVCNVCKVEKEDKEFIVRGRGIVCNNCIINIKREQDNKKREEKNKEINEIYSFKQEVKNFLKPLKKSDDEFLNFRKRLFLKKFLVLEYLDSFN